MPYWAVAQTISTREDTVAQRLDRIGYEVISPKARFRVGRMYRVAAVFPGYVFLKIHEGWYDAKWCMGVLRLIMNGESPAQLPDWEVVKIMEATGKNGLVKIAKAKPTPPQTQIAEGSLVRILTGSFRGINAIYAGMSVHERQCVLLDLLGRQVKTELAVDDRVELV